VFELAEQQFHKSVLHAMSVSAQRLEGEERISQSKLSRGGMTTFSIKTHTTLDRWCFNCYLKTHHQYQRSRVRRRLRKQ
jgi:hypothetical protein